MTKTIYCVIKTFSFYGEGRGMELLRSFTSPECADRFVKSLYSERDWCEEAGHKVGMFKDLWLDKNRGLRSPEETVPFLNIATKDFLELSGLSSFSEDRYFDISGCEFEVLETELECEE